MDDRALDAESQRVVTRGQGYLLRVGPDELDATRFERLLADGRRARAAGRPDAADALRAAVALWRGPALEEFADRSFARADIARLEELRLAALEERISVDLDLGRHAQVIAELETLVAAQPLRERIRGQLMLALYRSDRQAQALQVYRDTHRMFGEELGLDPSPELQRLERSILAHDPSLDWKPGVATAMAAPPAPGEPPYRGLEYFDVEDSARFFGREGLTARLVQRVRSTRLLAVVGASGSGKSSLVRAGLVAARDREAPADGRPGIVITPTAHPLEALALGLAAAGRSSRSIAGLVDDLARDPRTLHLAARRLAGRGPRREGEAILLVVDQFEELFTLCRDIGERSAFVANLMTAVAMGGPIAVVIALRADFYAHLAAYSDLRSAVAKEQEYIGPMTAEELRRTITGPAEQGDWRLGAGLVDLILHDLEDAPGALPLLSHALLETWHRRRGREMTVEGYGEAGGVRKAIAFTADRLFGQELDVDERAIGRRLLLRLTELGDGTADTRRRVALRELIPDSPPEANAASTRVLNRLTEARLVTTGENTAEVAHEALIREWPTLHAWLSEDREGLRMHRQITEAADQWEAMERDPGALYRGTRLARALDWAAAHPDTLNDRELAFVAESDVLARREDDEREAQHRRELEAAERLAEAERRRAEQEAASAGRLRGRAMALSGALLLAAVLGVVTLAFGLQARDSFGNADSQRLGAEANGILQRGESSELAALLAIRGMQAQYTPQADAALQRASYQQFSDRIITLPQRVDGFALSADGRSLLAGVGDGDAYLVGLDGGDIIRTFPGPSDYIPDADFSPDGTLAATVDTAIHLWDVASGTERWSIPVETQDATFSPDGRSLAFLLDGAATVLDVADGHVLKQLPIPDAGALFLAPDGRHAFATAGALGSLWDLDTGQQVREFAGHSARIAHVAFSPDGRLVATSAQDKTARIWDVGSGETLHTLTGHTEIVFQSAFSPDGSLLLTGSLDTNAHLWDVATGAQLRKLAGHTASVYSVAFTAEGTYALTTGRDGTIRFWDVDAPAERDTLRGPTSFMYALEYSPDGKLLFAGNADGTSQIWDVATQTVTHVLIRDARVDVAAFSPDGRFVLTAAEGRPAELWDTTTGALAASLGSPGGPLVADFSANGRVMIAAAGEGRVGVWDVATRQLVVDFAVHRFSGGTVSPDGARLLTFVDLGGEPNGTIWDVASGAQLHEFEHPLGMIDADFAPDGRTIFTTGRDNIARLWNADTGTLVREFRGHTNIMWRGAFSPDGRHVFTTSQDKSARMWDAETGQQIRYFPGHALSAVAGIAVSPDGQQVAIGSYDGFVQLTPIDRDALLSSVCERLRRDLTDEERTIYGIADQQATCG